MQDLATVVAFANLAVTLFGGAIFVLRLEGRMNVQAVMIDNLKGQLSTAGDAIKLLSNQTARMNLLESQVNDLRRGNGFITNTRESLVGEYP